MVYKTLGILGGGQLGRMSAQAAEKLGIKVIIFTPEHGSPASQVADKTIVAPYDDEVALSDFASHVDVISYEFENIPVKTIQYLSNLKPVYPEDNLLEIAQDRLVEKRFLNDIGIPTARWMEARSIEEIARTLKDWDVDQCIIKTTRFGYDGKGQSFIKSSEDIEKSWKNLNAPVVIVEDVVAFDCEISVIVARDKDGKTVCYGPSLNEHKNHILHKTTVPAGIDDRVAARAIKLAQTLAKKINLRGVLGLEMFVTKDGGILANEIAPRTHNSGHWSIDACAASQFENHVRAVCGLPLADEGRHGDAVMLNLIGNDISDIAQYENRPDVFIHDYGKKDIRPGRKMGHITFLNNNLPEEKQ